VYGLIWASGSRLKYEQWLKIEFERGERMRRRGWRRGRWIVERGYYREKGIVTGTEGGEDSN
jgi:hypothetical protein